MVTVEGFADEVRFYLFERHFFEARHDAGAGAEGEVAQADLGVLGQQDGAFDDVV